MTKEELEKEAEGYTNKLLEDWELYDPEALQEAYIAGAEPREKRIAELEKENAELKKEWQEQVQKATDEGYARTLQTMQLTKAKEHIENLLYYVKQCTCERSNYAEIEKDITEAEQFLNSEVEK